MHPAASSISSTYTYYPQGRETSINYPANETNLSGCVSVTSRCQRDGWKELLPPGPGDKTEPVQDAGKRPETHARALRRAETSCLQSVRFKLYLQQPLVFFSTQTHAQADINLPACFALRSWVCLKQKQHLLIDCKQYAVFSRHISLSSHRETCHR